MRAYFFANSWLSGIQKGLQAAHVVAEMANSASTVASWPREAQDTEPERTAASDDYFDWATSHKTILVLEGGSHDDLKEICALLDTKDNPFSWTSFSEDEESLNGAMTCVGIILPERIYEAASVLRKNKIDVDRWSKLDPDHPHFSRKVRLGEKVEEYTEWEIELIKLINSRPLAR